MVITKHLTAKKSMLVLSAVFLTTVVSACGDEASNGGGGNGDEGNSGNQVTVVERTVIVREDDAADGATGGGEQDRNEQASASNNNNGGGQTGDRDGVYAVGDGGEVEFERTDNGLRLVEARPNPGWTTEVNDRGPEEIDVEFRRGNVEWHFEAEFDDGVLRVEPADRDTDDRGDD